MRLARAAVLGASSVLLAVGAHLTGGGMVPNAALLMLTICATGVIAVSLTSRRCGLPLLLTVLGLEQTGLHLVFAAGSATAIGSCGPVDAAHHLHAVAACGLAVSPAGLEHAGLSMILAHVGAIVLTAWLLARGEQWVWRMVSEATRTPAVRGSRRRPRALRQVPIWLPVLGFAPLETPAPTRGPPRAQPVF